MDATKMAWLIVWCAAVLFAVGALLAIEIKQAADRICEAIRENTEELKRGRHDSE